jgi:hypothetical protein
VIHSERGNKIILLDNSQVLIANIFSVTKSQSKIDENFIRHLVLNTYRMVNTKFSKSYGELIICDDTSHCWRKDNFEFYKANRKRDQKKSSVDWNEIFDVMNTIRTEVRENFPYKCMAVDRVEADDVIAVLAKNYHESERVLIVSNDKDFQQLQRYPNVEQYSLMKKQFLVCDNPEKFLMEHIIKGDSSDGIPNVLSDDDTFMVQDKRQKPCGKKRIEQIMDDPSNEEWEGNFKRNQTMIDMTMIPEIFESNILEEFGREKDCNDRSKILNYFIKNKLRNLMSSIGDF